MWTAFPSSDYYEGSAPSRGHQPTTRLPAAGNTRRRGGRPRDGSHVHHRPVDGGGAQLFPCSLATGTPQAFPVASQPAQLADVGVARTHRARACTALRPISARLEPVLDLRGFNHWFLHTYTFPSRLPDPDRLAVPTRPVVVGAAPTLTRVSGLGLPPASAGCCDSPQVRPFHPHQVKWHFVAHDRLPVDAGRLHSDQRYAEAL